ncbi:MAG TPA: winged helix-turn-helix domain-containing protein [Anaerolineaceae bacterium]|jgi:transposase
MAKRKFTLSEAEEQGLFRAFLQEKDGATRTRYLAVRMYGRGHPFCEIQDLTGCSRASLMEWARAYRQFGPDHLQDQRLGGNRAKLTVQQQAELIEKLHAYTPAQVLGPQAATPTGQFWTVADLQRVVQQWYEVTFASRSSYTHLFSLCGFSYQHPAKVFRSHSQEKVADFEEQVEKK